MAIQEAERQAIIAMINSQSPAVRDFCTLAFRLGHEEGWWLARTDPNSTVSPVEHAETTNPFIAPEECSSEAPDQSGIDPQPSPDGSPKFGVK